MGMALPVNSVLDFVHKKQVVRTENGLFAVYPP